MDEDKGNSTSTRDEHGGHDSGMGMMGMMAMCLGVILLFLVLPAVGLPFGLPIALAAGVLMLVLHGRFMRHGAEPKA
jgi:hypothetical protein